MFVAYMYMCIDSNFYQLVKKAFYFSNKTSTFLKQEHAKIR